MAGDNNVYEVILRMRDEASASLLNVEKAAKSARTAIEGVGKASTGSAGGSGVNKLSDEAKAARDAIAKLDDSFGRLQGTWNVGMKGAKAYSDSMVGIQQQAFVLVRDLDLTGAQVKKLGQLFKSAGTEQAVAEKAMVALQAATVKVGAATEQILPPWKLLRQEVFDLRDALEAGTVSEEEFIRQQKLIQSIALSAREGIALEARATKDGAEAWHTYTLAAGSASRYIATAEGRTTKLGLSANIATAGMRGLTNAMYYMGPAGAAMGGVMGTFGGAIEALGPAGLAAAGGVAALGGAAFALLRTGIPQVAQMQQGLQLLAATGNSESMSKLTSQLDAAAQAAGKAGTQFSRAELATGLARLVKAGMSLNDALSLLPSSMQLAVESGQSFEQASTNLLTNLRQFGMGASSAAEAAGALGVASLRARENAQALSQGLATVGPIANQAGLSFDQTLGILVTLSNTGLNAADKGARALRVDITKLLKPSAAAAKALDKFGVATKDNAGHQKSVATILQQVIQAASTYGITIDKATGKVVGNKDAIALLSSIFQNRGVTAIASLTSQLKSSTNSWQANTDAIRNGKDNLQAYTDTLLSSNLVAAQANLRTSWQNMAETLTVVFAPALVKAMNALSGYLDQVDRAVQASKGNALTAGGIALDTLETNVYRATVGKIMPGFINRALVGPPPTPSQAAQYGIGNRGSYGAGGSRSGPAVPSPTDNMPVLSQSQRLLRAHQLVQAEITAMKGTSVNAMIAAADALKTWEAAKGNKTEAALRTAVVTYTKTAINNATTAAAQELKKKPVTLPQIRPGAQISLAISTPVANLNGQAYGPANTLADTLSSLNWRSRGQQTAILTAGQKLQLQVDEQLAQYVATWAKPVAKSIWDTLKNALQKASAKAKNILWSEEQAQIAAGATLQGGPVDQAAIARQRQSSQYALQNLISLPHLLGAAVVALGKTYGEKFIKGLKDFVQSGEMRQAVKRYQNLQVQMLEDTLRIIGGQGKRVQLGSNAAARAVATVSPAYAYMTSGTGSFEDRLNQLAQAGRDVAVYQKQAAAAEMTAAEKLAKTATTWAGAVQQLQAAGQSTTAAGFISGLGSTASTVAGLIPGGGVAQSIIGVASSFASGFTNAVANAFASPTPDMQAAMTRLTAAGANWMMSGYGQAMTTQQQAGKGLNFVNPSSFTTTTVRHGPFFNLFGFDLTGPQVTTKVNALGQKIGQAIDSGVTGGLASGITAFLQGSTDWKTKLKQGIADAIIQGITDAVVQGAIIKGALAGPLTQLTKDLQNSDWNAARSDIQKITSALPGLMNHIQQTLQPLQGALSPYYSATSTAASASALSTTQFTSGVVDIAWYDFGQTLKAGISDFREAVDEFRKGTNVNVTIQGIPAR